MKSAIPLYSGVAPHEQIVTQYSVHVCRAPGDVSDHRQFLADPARDCRRELAERLLEDLEHRGSIIVYSSFEKTMLGNLAQRFPDLRTRLKRCIGRLFDLERTFREHVCHPACRGRTSIKFTGPALTDITYDGFDIGDGDTAMARFARMVRGEIVGDEAESIRRALLEYCRQDTYAMVRLHEELVRYAGRLKPR